MSDEIKISYELLNEKLSQINEAKKSFNNLCHAYGEQERKFQNGEIVRLYRNGRKYAVVSAEFSYSAFSDSFELRVSYMLKPQRKGDRIHIRAMESEIAPIRLVQPHNQKD